MRFPEEQIKQAILHPHLQVRRAAIEYFASVPGEDTTVMPLVIEAVGALEPAEGWQLLLSAVGLPQTPATVDWLIDQLHRDWDLEDVRQDNYCSAVAVILDSTRPELLIERKEAICDAPAFPELFRTMFLDRLEWSTWDWSRGWQWIIGTCGKECRNEETAWDASRQLHRMVDVLADRAVDGIAELTSLFEGGAGFPEEPSEDFLSCCVARLAGATRREEFIDPLLDELIEGSDEVLVGACRDGLIRLGSDSVVARLAPLLPTTYEDVRENAATIFGKIRSDLSIQKCVEAFWEETDCDIRGQYCGSLLNHLADESIDLAREFILDSGDAFDQDVFNLRDRTVAAAMLTDRPFPELDQWKARAEEELWDADPEPGRLSNMFAGENFIEGIRSAVRDLISAWEEEDGEDGEFDDGPFPPSVPRDNYRLDPPAPIVSKPPKTGRNEPCPCGSGMKFKKCCLKKTDDAMLD